MENQKVKSNKNDGRIITPEQMKAEECLKAVNGILEKYGCVLLPIFAFNGIQLDARCQVVAKSQIKAAVPSAKVPGGAK